MKIPENRVPRVALAGLDGRPRSLFTLFVQGPAKGSCDLVAETEADAVIVDVDGPAGLSLWEEVSKRFVGPVLLMSVRDHDVPEHLLIRKPLTEESFRAAMARIADQRSGNRFGPGATARAQRPAGGLPANPGPDVGQAAPTRSPSIAPPPPMPEAEPVERAAPPGVHLQPARADSVRGMWDVDDGVDFCGDIDDSVYLDPSRRAEVQYNPAEYLQGLLQKAHDDGSRLGVPILIDDLGQRILVLPATRQVHSEVHPRILRSLCMLPTMSGRGNLRVLNRDEKAEFEPNDPHLHDYSQFLWTATVLAARGRIPAEIDPEAPFRFRRWPNFTRLIVPPYAMQVAALWSRSPVSLMQTARMLKIPHRYVFTTFSGCHALGLIERRERPRGEVPRVPVKAVADRPVTREKRSFLGSLLRKLMGSG